MAALLAIVFSLIIAYVPIFKFITSGFAVIVSALVASVAAALLFPIDEGKEGEGE